jgi:acetolactate synthase-1/2/3 large subunit
MRRKVNPQKAEYVQNNQNMRALGVQGLKMWQVVENLTKKSYVVTDPTKIKCILDEAFIEATTGRPGPVWVEIPQDVQWAEIVPENLVSNIIETSESELSNEDLGFILSAINSSKRPLIWAGNGIRLSDSVDAFKNLLEKD